MSARERVPSDDAAGRRFCIVAAQWNERFVRRLVDGAVATLLARGAAEADVEVRWVPGSLELPWAANLVCGGGQAPHAVIAVGCVIRGETEHFRLVADNAAAGLARVAIERGVPVLNGVLAVEDAEQAEARCGGEHGNTGAQAALAAVRCANLAASRWAS